jgi:ERCC4-related helicase
MKQLVCLVIDEAHRASGNYAYCMAVRKVCLMLKYFIHLILSEFYNAHVFC